MNVIIFQTSDWLTAFIVDSMTNQMIEKSTYSWPTLSMKIRIYVISFIITEFFMKKTLIKLEKIHREFIQLI